MRHALVAALLLTSLVAFPASAGPVARITMTSPIFFSDGNPDLEPNNPTPPPIEASSGTPVPFAMVGQAFDLDIVHSGGRGARTTTLLGSLPGVAVDSSGISGTLTVPGTYSFSVQVSDEAAQTKVLGPWTIEVDPILSIGAMSSTLNVVAGTQQSFALPTINGGLSPYVLSVEPADARLNIVGNELRVLVPTAGTLGNFTIKANDQRPGRAGVSSNAFSVVAAAPTVNAAEAYVQDVAGGTLVKSATNRITATAAGRGAANTIPAVRINAGQSVIVTYDRVVRANRLVVGYVPPYTACSNATPDNKFMAGNPVFTVATSVDGSNWTTHSNTGVTSASAHCGFGGGSVYFAEGATDVKYIRYSLSSARSNASGNPTIGVDVIVLRALN